MSSALSQFRLNFHEQNSESTGWKQSRVSKVPGATAVLPSEGADLQLVQAHQESFCLALDLLSLTCYMQHSFGSSFLLWSLYCLAFSPLSGCECQRRAVLVSALSLIEVQPISTYERCHFPAAFPSNCCMLKTSQFSVLVLQAWWVSHQAHLSFMLWEAELGIAMLTARSCAGLVQAAPCPVGEVDVLGRKLWRMRTKSWLRVTFYLKITHSTSDRGRYHCEYKWAHSMPVEGFRDLNDNIWGIRVGAVKIQEGRNVANSLVGGGR